MTVKMTAKVLQFSRAIIEKDNNGPAICDSLGIYRNSSTRVRRAVCDTLGCELHELMDVLGGIDLSEVEVISIGQQCVISREMRKTLGLPPRDQERCIPIQPRKNVKWPDYSPHNLKFR